VAESQRTGSSGRADSLAARILGGDTRALARGITLVESGRDGIAALLRELYPRTGRSITLGITGFPGAGKSSLVDRLIETYRSREKKVGVVAVDPSSAFSGGAILGDRVRMMRHTSDEGVFIRSMATRGHLGGLARATGEVMDLLDASGRDVVIIETVGVGQDEIEIASLADVVLVVLVPGMGDDIQAIKAGILEIADLFVINKADREGADKLVAELRAMMTLVEDRPRQVPILKTIATRGEGIDDLVAGIDLHLTAPDMAERRFRRRVERANARLRDLLCQTVLRRTIAEAGGAEAWEKLIDRIARRDLDPYEALEKILEGRGR
jgi:LAO/AO transport system kinase